MRDQMSNGVFLGANPGMQMPNAQQLAQMQMQHAAEVAQTHNLRLREFALDAAVKVMGNHTDSNMVVDAAEKFLAFLTANPPA